MLASTAATSFTQRLASTPLRKTSFCELSDENRVQRGLRRQRCKEKPLVRPISGLENLPAHWRQRSPDDEWRLRGPRRHGFPDQVLRGNAQSKAPSKDRTLRTGRN